MDKKVSKKWVKVFQILNEIAREDLTVREQHDNLIINIEKAHMHLDRLGKEANAIEDNEKKSYLVAAIVIIRLILHSAEDKVRLLNIIDEIGQGGDRLCDISREGTRFHLYIKSINDDMRVARNSLDSILAGH